MRPGSVETKFIVRDKIAQMFDSIEGEVFLPKKGEGHFVWSGYQGDNFSLEGFRPTISPKYFFYAPREILRQKKVHDRTVAGVKACDLRGMKFLRKVFKEGNLIDPFFRDDLFIISADCTYPDQTCFCTFLGDNPYPEPGEGFDLNLSLIKDGYLVEMAGDRGRELVRKREELFLSATPSQLEERDQIRKRVAHEIGRDLIDLREKITPDKAKADIVKCVSCGACTNICPGCFCFLLQETKDFEKVRFWDSCQFPGYARVAGGGNPRKELDQRFIHRVRCKFEYCPQRYGQRGCFACGRCTTACIGGIDFQDVLQSLQVHSL